MKIQPPNSPRESQGQGGTVIALCLPSHNEKANLELLLPELDLVLSSPGSPQALVVVFDDGSTDGTSDWLVDCDFAGFDLVVVRSRVRVGKSIALNQAFKRALESEASSIWMLDADGQDDPANILPMLEELNRGVDLVNARRLNRQHGPIKRQSSRLFNLVVRLTTGIKIYDINSGMKCFSREAAEVLTPYFYGESHRVILVIALRVGLAVGEVKVLNRARRFGASNYGVARGWRGLMDLFATKFMQRYHSRPGHFFSGVGSSFFGGGIVTLVIGLSIQTKNLVIGGFDLLTGAGLMGIALGAMLICFGFVSELVIFVSKNPLTTVVRVHEPVSK